MHMSIVTYVHLAAREISIRLGILNATTHPYKKPRRRPRGSSPILRPSSTHSDRSTVQGLTNGFPRLLAGGAFEGFSWGADVLVAHAHFQLHHFDQLHEFRHGVEAQEG